MTAMFARAAVIGLGLIGGSLAAGLRRAELAQRIVGYAPQEAELALELGLVDELATEPGRAVAHADLVVLAAPPSALPALLQATAPLLDRRAVLTDVASTKRGIAEAAERVLGDKLGQFVPAHPIAGSERSGPRAARADLFSGARVILTPTAQTAPAALARIEAMWAALGARVSRMAPTEHDAVFARVSHLPHAAAFALAAMLAAEPDAGELQGLAGAGLRDTTRIAASSPELWADIFLENDDLLLAAARRFRDELDTIVGLIEAGDRSALCEALGRASRWRGALSG
ncbi:MAG: prephenate dehydrogenase/arogenate dehydrogenase family protein [Burkholderiales bacterium]|nr:MAG: prephenate dehydrogenase/arogenate dehydrogenase family protein [Burkholderiales bacterium]